MSSCTRLGPSKLVPGAKGVFLQRPLKKFTPVEITLKSDAAAPPFVLNLLHAPRRSISLRRFLALRHQFSSSNYFNVATAAGWYLIAPSNYAPLADKAGLQAWRERHHYYYEKKAEGRRRIRRGNNNNNNNSNSNSNSEMLSSQDRTGVRRTYYNGPVTSSSAVEPERIIHNDDDYDDYCTEVPPASTTMKINPTACGVPRITIPEEHLFEINDGVLWETPPPDDLGNPVYWKYHRKRMELYEDTCVPSEQEEVLQAQLHREAGGLVEQEMYLQGQHILHALTRKANVRLSVDDSTQLVTLMPIIDMHEGEELFLHYGREWWSQRLLASLFISVADNEMQGIRWIESLFSKPTDVARPFPLLCSAVRRRKVHVRNNNNNDRNTKANDDVEERRDANKKQKLVLYNMASHRKATDAEVLVFSIRRSCVDRVFFSQLVDAGGAAVFDVSRCDEEVPIHCLRRALLQSLHAEGTSSGAALSIHAKEEVDDNEEDGSLSL